MKRIRKRRPLIVAALAIALMAGPSMVEAQGRRGAGGPPPEMQTIHSLMDAHTKVKRSVKDLPNGVETLTESNDPKVAKLIQTHVAEMAKRLQEGRLIRGFDPLFVEIFRNHDWVKIKLEKTVKGMKVIETSEDAYVVKLIQAHAQAVNGFVKDGWDVMHKQHEVPKKPGI